MLLQAFLRFMPILWFPFSDENQSVQQRRKKKNKNGNVGYMAHFYIENTIRNVRLFWCYNKQKLKKKLFIFRSNESHLNVVII